MLFHIESDNGLNAYHRSRTVNLLDAHVISGRAATDSVDTDEEVHFARRYQDGLETNDSTEDTLFIIWYSDIDIMWLCESLILS